MWVQLHDLLADAEAVHAGADGQEAFQCLLKHGAIFDDNSAAARSEQPRNSQETRRVSK